jgi:hypothetical protein
VRKLLDRAPRAGSRLVIGAAASLVLTLALVFIAQQQSAAASTTFTSTFGYQISLPSGWRQSTLISRAIAGDALHLGHDVFTVRSDTEERQLASRSEGTPGPAWQGVVAVEAYNNPTNLTSSQWASSPLLAGWAKGQTLDVVTFDGKSIARLTNGARYSVAYFVAVPGKMLLVGERADTPTMFAAGVTKATLDSIVASFHALP